MATPTQPANVIEMTPEQIRQIASGVAPQPTPPQPQPSPTQPQPAPQQQPPAPAPSPTGPAPAPTQAPANGQITRLADNTYELRLPTGQVYKGRTETELVGALANAQVNASQRITQLSDEAARFRAGLEAVTGRQQPTDGQTPTIQFDPAVYRELAQSDPMLAFQYQLGALFGASDINEVPRTVQKIIDNSTRYETQMAINQFRAMAPDFPGSQDAIQKVIGFMRDKNIPFSADNLLLVHQGMVTRGPQNGGYEPLKAGEQPGVQPAPANQPIPPVPAPVAPTVTDPNPQGLYSFGPDGFGSRPLPAVPPPAPVAQPAPVAPVAPAPAPVAPNPYAAYPPAPAPVAAPTAYPSIPVPANVPMPAAPVGTPSAHVPAGQLTEDQIAAMPKEQLRQYIEANLQR